MVLSKSAEYALRAVCCIAKSGDTPMRAIDIADICNILPHVPIEAAPKTDSGGRARLQGWTPGRIHPRPIS